VVPFAQRALAARVERRRRTARGVQGAAFHRPMISLVERDGFGTAPGRTPPLERRSSWQNDRGLRCSGPPTRARRRVPGQSSAAGAADNRQFFRRQQEGGRHGFRQELDDSGQRVPPGRLSDQARIVESRMRFLPILLFFWSFRLRWLLLPAPAAGPATRSPRRRTPLARTELVKDPGYGKT